MSHDIKRELRGPQVRACTRDSRLATGKQSEPLAGQLVVLLQRVLQPVHLPTVDPVRRVNVLDFICKKV